MSDLRDLLAYDKVLAMSLHLMRLTLKSPTQGVKDFLRCVTK